MTNLPSKQELKELKAFKLPFCLSIYAPFINPNAATNPNRIELKNLLREAQTALLADGVDLKDVKKTLRPAKELLKNDEFWPIHHEGLALFMHPKLFRYYHVPGESIPYLLTVEKGFNLAPLEEILRNNKPYYVLALGHKNVQLYEGDRFGLRLLQLKDFPSNMKESLGIDEYPQMRETHTIAPAVTGKGSEGYHSQYNVSQTDKAMLLEFFRRIDKRLHTFFKNKQTPLVLAGVEYLVPIYRRVNTYKYLATGSIKGNIEHSKLADTQKRAWSLINKQSSVNH